MVDSAVVSTVDDAFMKGFNADVRVSAASTTGESVAQSVVATPSETEVSSSVESESGSAVQSSAASAIDYEQKWKSGQGIVRSQSVALSKALSENESLKASHYSAGSTAVTAASSETAPDGKKIKELRRKRNEAVIEGDLDAAEKLDEEIDVLSESRKVITKEELRTEVVATVTAKEEEDAVSKIVATAHTMYPFLNHNLPDKNERAIKYVQLEAGNFIDQGFKKAEAISMAVSAVVPLFGKTVSMSTSSEVDDSKMRGLAPVDGKTRPVKTSQKSKGSGTFEDGFNSA